jgi:hypothetical protein
VVTGAIFTEDQKGSSAELAFKYAVYRINKDTSLLPNTTLVYDMMYVPRDDSFRTSKKGRALRAWRAWRAWAMPVPSNLNGQTTPVQKDGVFWDVTPCGSCKNRRFGGT